MNIQQSLDGMLDTENTDAYCLSQLEIYNWGPFSGFHRIMFDPDGCSLIGQTGSGKTTLVDAIMTLICAQPRYNLASTGGHESDRDLLSYVRGVTGTGGDDETIHTARPGQTMTGISVELSQKNTRVYLSVLFWLDGSSNSQSDMKRLWLFDKSTVRSQSDMGLADYLQLLKEQGVRNFKRQLKEREGLALTENKKTYLAQIRRFFEVGENAFVLLNRAAGLKQLNSIDELFRELVLDNRAAFKRAEEVANEFDDLSGIHTELEIARQQQQSLLPVEKSWHQQQKANQKLTLLNQQNALLPQWFAHQGNQLWTQHAEVKTNEIALNQSALEQTEKQLRQQQNTVDDYYQRYQKFGGANIEDLKRQVTEQQQQLVRLQQNIRDYQQLCQTLTLNSKIQQQQLIENKRLASQKLEQLNKQLSELEATRESQTQQTLNAEDQCKTLSQEISEVAAAPDSNISPDFLRFQQALADELDVSIQQIPYIGQCVEVQDKNWQGAIERAIGSHRLRLVIAAENMPKALRWINQRNNRLHIRLLNSADYQYTKSAQKNMNDGFCQKLKFKPGWQQTAVKNFLSSIDRHCVANSDELQATPYGLTQQGLMSGKRGLFEKQDQRSLTQGWMTGFDNRHRLAELKQQLTEIKLQAQNFRQQFENTKNQYQQLQQQKSLLTYLQTLDFNELDAAGTEAVLAQLDERLCDLQDAQSDTAKAEKLWLSAKEKLAAVQKNINAISIELATAQQDLKNSLSYASQAKDRFAQLLTEKLLAQAATTFVVVGIKQREELAHIEREATRKLQQKMTRQQDKLKEIEVQLGRQMVFAKQKDTGVLSEAGVELEDAPVYLKQLQQLTKEALPEKLERFMQYLNQSSDQGVTQLLTSIENEVSVIEERIEDLNTTLRAVDFQAGKYLQLVPQKVSHESLQTLHHAQRELRSAALQDDQGESHYKALMALIQLLRDAVERKRTRPAQALLDPRYRLQFSVAIIERDTGTEYSRQTGSKSGSGGEKEIITSFILTASLSYALCPKNRTTPLFGTVILDEAFSKSSQAVAARIISALREFGLHPLFVTPNKEMRLLRNHTSSAVLVHRRQQQSTALSLSWQEIDKHLKQRQ